MPQIGTIIKGSIKISQTWTFYSLKIHSQTTMTILMLWRDFMIIKKTKIIYNNMKEESLKYKLKILIHQKIRTSL